LAEKTLISYADLTKHCKVARPCPPFQTPYNGE